MVNDPTYRFILGFLVFAIVAVIGYFVWFHANYECVRSHHGTCSTTVCNNFGDDKSPIIICQTNEYPCEVCDEYQERKR